MAGEHSATPENASLRKLLISTVIGCVAFAAACTSPTTSTTQAKGPIPTPTVAIPDAYTPVLVSVLGKPTFPFLGTDGKYHIAYDLEFTNASLIPATLQKVEVLDAADQSRVVATFDADVLFARDPKNCQYAECGLLRTLKAFNGKVTSADIPPNASLMMYVTYAFDSLNQAPKEVVHRISLISATISAPQSPVPLTEVATPYNISAGTPMTLGPPVAGKNWVALNGCCDPFYPHVTSANAFNGQLLNSQRFAIDWKQTNDQGLFFAGDRTKNESYVDYGSQILAVADGTVEAVLDELEPNDPGILPANDPVKRQSLTIKTADGNFIILNMGNGTYANYAHLQKGTMKVKAGDKVKKGQVIALLGNTGNANASHMHFHVMDGPSPFASNGLPYVIDKFDLVGQMNMAAFNGMDDYLQPPSGLNFFPVNPGPPQPRTNQLPMANTIVNFPG